MWPNQIKTDINQALTSLELPIIDYTVEHPQDESYGDYAANTALVLFPILKQSGNTAYPNPHSLAEAIIHQLNYLTTQPPNYQTISVAGPGFINFSLKIDRMIERVNTFFHSFDSLKTINQGKRIVVEYSSPNIAKPFTVGHLRSTIIGDAIANLLEATGWQVYRDNHVGDWGTQFGKQILAIKKWGDLETIKQSPNPVKDLVALYVKYHEAAEQDPSLDDEAREWFKKLEQGDAEARTIWKTCIDLSWKEFSRIYQELGITFSENHGRGYGESFFEDKMQPVLDELQQKNLLTKSEGAELIFFPNDMLPPLMVTKKDGATLYATRDLATDKFRLEHYGQDIIVLNEIGAEQSEYMQQIYQAETMLGWYTAGQRIHIGHGLFRFKDGKMSTRKGNVVWLEDVINESIERAKQLQKAPGSDNEPVAKQVAIGALKYNDLKRRPGLSIVFDWDEILNMEGDSGPYLQYTVARCTSVLNKNTVPITSLSSDIPFNDEEVALIKWLGQYDEVVTTAASEYAPSKICSYCYELAQRFNTFYHQHTIIGNPSRVTLTNNTCNTLKHGLSILGIQCPAHM